MKLWEQLDALNLGGAYVKDFYKADSESTIYFVKTLRNMTSKLTFESLVHELSIAGCEKFKFYLFAHPELESSIQYDISIHIYD